MSRQPSPSQPSDPLWRSNTPTAWMGMILLLLLSSSKRLLALIMMAIVLICVLIY